MAKGTWSWGEVASGKKAKTGGSGSGGGFVYSDMQYEIGEVKRVTIPYLRDTEGNLKMMIYSAPIHYVTDRGFITLTGPKGGKFSPYSIRCMNPMSQTDFNTGKEIAERNQFCALCTLANLQTTARFSKIDEEFGDIESFKATPKDDERKVNLIARLNAGDKVRESYDKRKKEVHYESYILVLEMETTVKEVATQFGNKKVSSVHLDAQGLPKYKPTLMKASKVRLDKFQKAFEKAGSDGFLTEDSLHYFTDQTGAEVRTAFLDYELTFPSHTSGTANDKKASAAGLEVVVMPSTDSVITEPFINAVLDRSDFLIEKSDIAWEKHSHLQEFTNEEYTNVMKDFGAYYNELKAQYLTDADREFAYKVIETAKGNNMFAKDESEGSETVVVTEETPTEKPVKENTASAENVTVKPDLLNMDI